MHHLAPAVEDDAFRSPEARLHLGKRDERLRVRDESRGQNRKDENPGLRFHSWATPGSRELRSEARRTSRASTWPRPGSPAAPACLIRSVAPCTRSSISPWE